MAKSRVRKKPVPVVIDLNKPRAKMVKRELLGYIKELERTGSEHSRAYQSAKDDKMSWEGREAKLKEDKQEAITALEVWKSGCLEAQESNVIMQNRLSTLRNMMELELLKTPLEEAETKETKDRIIHSIVKKLARTLVDMEAKIKPFIDSFLPVPQIITMMNEERHKRQNKSKQVRKHQLEDQLSQGFFTN